VQSAPSTGHAVPLVGSLDGHAMTGASVPIGTSLDGASFDDVSFVAIVSFVVASLPLLPSMGTTLPPQAMTREDATKTRAKDGVRMPPMIRDARKFREALAATNAIRIVPLASRRPADTLAPMIPPPRDDAPTPAATPPPRPTLNPPRLPSIPPPPEGVLPHPGFQLKYTFAVAGIALLLMLALGVAIERVTDTAVRAAEAAVDQSARAMEASQNSSRVVRMSEIERAADNPDLVHALERELTVLDQQAAQNAAQIRAQRAEVAQLRKRTLVTLSVLGGALVLFLAVVGIVATRRIVTPMMRLRRLLRKVTRGKLDIREKIQGDVELRELFDAFGEMVDSLKRAQAREIADLTVAIREAETTGTSVEVIQRLRDLKSSMEIALQPPDATVRVSLAAVKAAAEKL
jgi:HAMP domain-containing protein